MGVSRDFRRWRADGWPYCPRCDEDELYSVAVPATVETICGCYRCGPWPIVQSPGRRPFDWEAEGVFDEDESKIENMMGVGWNGENWDLTLVRDGCEAMITGVSDEALRALIGDTAVNDLVRA